MKRVEGFLTTDNKFFEDESQAKDHQNGLDFKIKLTDFVERNGYNSMDKSDIIDMLLENKNDLISIFNIGNALSFTEQEVITMLKDKKGLLECVKFYKEKTGKHLKESKEAVEYLREKYCR